MIAIIAILAAILFPVFAQAKEAAKKASCLSNQKQIGTASMLYSGDYDDMVCKFSGYYNSPTRMFTHWYGRETLSPVYRFDPTQGLLYPYMKSVAITDCPSAASLPRANAGTVFAIGYNNQITPYYSGPSNGLSETQVSLPAETILFADSVAFDDSGPSMRRFGAVDGYNDCYPSLAHGRHSGKANVAWFDGHAKSANVALVKSASDCGGSVDSNDAFKKKNSLGFVMKYPKEDPNVPDMSARDGFYYLIEKAG